MSSLTLPDGEFTIAAAANLIAKRIGAIYENGAPAAKRVVMQLRIWQYRYGWPVPRRHTNGYRIFTAYDVEQIVRLYVLLGSGRQIGELIVDGMPTWPSARPPSMFHRLVAYVDEHRHLSGEHARYLRLIEAAIRGRSGLLQALLVEVSCLVHPLHRASIAWLPTLIGLAAWDSVARPLPDADAMRQFIRDQIGSDAIAALLEQVANPEKTP